MAVIVRSAASEDAALLHALAAQTFGLACPPGTSQDDVDDFIARHLSVERFAEYLADPARVLQVVEVDGVAAGYTMLIFSVPIDAEPNDPDVAAAVASRPTAELSKVYVLAGQHGRGVAATLIAAAVEVARERGVASVWLGVNQGNGKANRFYEKNGFAVVGTRKFLVGGREEDDFVRERLL